MTRMEFERPVKVNLNSILTTVTLLTVLGTILTSSFNSYADYRGTGESVASLKQQVSDQQKGLQTLSAKVIEVQQMFTTKLADSQFQTATKLVGIERDVDYIKKAVERLEKAAAPR